MREKLKAFERVLHVTTDKPISKLSGTVMETTKIQTKILGEMQKYQAYVTTIQYAGQQGDRAAASQQDGFSFKTWLQPFCAGFPYSLSACVGLFGYSILLLKTTTTTKIH